MRGWPRAKLLSLHHLAPRLGDLRPQKLHVWHHRQLFAAQGWQRGFLSISPRGWVGSGCGDLPVEKTLGERELARAEALLGRVGRGYRRQTGHSRLPDSICTPFSPTMKGIPVGRPWKWQEQASLELGLLLKVDNKTSGLPTPEICRLEKNSNLSWKNQSSSPESTATLGRERLPQCFPPWEFNTLPRWGVDDCSQFLLAL